uniref:Uncharacterized protein n=1 Tax=Anguilla anguilla TaxID=7936 RepID=A0A0E9TID4_ANGAN
MKGLTSPTPGGVPFLQLCSQESLEGVQLSPRLCSS